MLAIGGGYIGLIHYSVLIFRHPELVSGSICPHKPSLALKWMLKQVQDDGSETKYYARRARKAAQVNAAIVC
jgi:hypothetical protein